ncbi:MAG: DsbA family protein [Chloroflexi bacterium]|nr:MAG: DsbA family protein [Chloroflexota bacterium]
MPYLVVYFLPPSRPHLRKGQGDVGPALSNSPTARHPVGTEEVTVSSRTKRARAAARAQARRRRQRITLIGIAVVVALLITGGLILLGTGRSSNTADLSSDVPTGFTDEGFPYRGSPDAPVKIIEFSDYLCPHCRDFNLETAPRIDETFVATGKVQYINHYFALGPNRIPIVEAAYCAADQGKFWEYHHTLFANQGRFQRADLIGYARQLGLDVETFTQCLDSGKHRQAIEAAIQSAQELGVNATPTFLINGQMLRGAYPFEIFQQVIEQALAGAGL